MSIASAIDEEFNDFDIANKHTLTLSFSTGYSDSGPYLYANPTLHSDAAWPLSAAWVYHARAPLWSFSKSSAWPAGRG